MRRAPAIAALLFLGACPAQTPAPAPAELLVENARIVLEKHCGRCHISTYETALPRALAIFDLLDNHWNAQLTPQQLASAKARIDAVETIDGEPSEVTSEERALIAKFVAAELELRNDAQSRNQP